MTRPVEDGQPEVDLGNTAGDARGALQRAAPIGSPFAGMMALSDARAIHWLAPEMTAMRKLADVVKPFDGKAMAAAFGASNNLFQHNADWAPDMRVAKETAAALAAAAQASAIRWDLVAGAMVNASAPATDAVSVPTRRSTSAATRHAKKARTVADFGDALRALRLEASMSLNDLVAYVDAKNKDGAKIVGLSKTVLSNACQGRQLFQTSTQVIHFVTACGAKADVDVWLDAWRRAKKNRGARLRGSGPTTAAAPKAVADVGGWWLSGPADEVVQVIHIPVTRGQVRAAVAAMAILGLVASSASAPAVRAAGLTALGVAAVVTLVDQAQARAARLQSPAAA